MNGIGSLVVRFESSRGVAEVERPRLQEWFLALDTVDEYGDTTDTVGHVIAYAVDDCAGSDLSSLHDISPSAGRIAQTLLNAPHDDLPGLLVIDTVRLKPRWCGHGIEALAVGMAVEELATEHRLVALSGKDAVAARLGFRPAANGVWTLHPRRDHVTEVMRSVRAELGLV